MKKVIRFIQSLQLTVILLSLSMVLVFAGTLAQVEQSIWTVVGQYFRCLIAWIDLSVFFPRSLNFPSIKVPFPGGFLIGCLLTINLIAVYGTRFKISARGKRKKAGYLLLGFGVLVTCAVMFGWGTSAIAATENDAFWRVFLRLGRGTLAAIVFFGACQLLYGKRAGMVLLHAGILFLLVGEFATAMYAVESSMTIKEGETVNFIDHNQQFELAFIETSNPQFDQVTVIPKKELHTGATITSPQLPFKIRINQYMANSSRPQMLNRVSPNERQAYPSYKSQGNKIYITSLPDAAGSNSRNAPSVDLDLIDPEKGESIGRYLFSLWFYPNFVGHSWDLPTKISYNNKEFTIYFRFRREYLMSPNRHPYSITLLDFIHEKYEGTQTPKDFSSKIRLVNAGDQVNRELRIWMNNPLRYAQRTFYQSGYLPNNEGTVLQVVRNDTWMIPYLACMMVFLGMGAQFIQSLTHYLRKEAPTHDN